MAGVACDAATMLAEALEKMDGLINDDKIIAESLKNSPPSLSRNDRLLCLLDEVKTLVEGMSYDGRTQVPVPHFTAEFIADWLASVQVREHSLHETGRSFRYSLFLFILEQNSRSNVGNKSSLSNGETSHVQNIERLEEEKESLILQVSVLTDQVEAQGEKIRDTEFTLEEMQIKLEEAEQQLEKVKTSL